MSLPPHPFDYDRSRWMPRTMRRLKPAIRISCDGLRLTLCRWAATAEKGHLLRNLTVGSSGGL